MPRSLFRIAKTTLLALTAAAILACPGHADPLNPGQRNKIIQSAGKLDLALQQTLVAIQRRREFQQQQQRFREQDRQSNQQPQRLKVPLMQPSNPSAVHLLR
ncbi:hypothetical protein [Allomesorhizobium alhagi]|jgi:hypothetical protein|uniref:Uncharacterized protein n=1 Tax=Mesorhizobium alhagi CCNWXJ12-2 TaxID=1107882 RepID=H0I2N0_9HYPH|nr:hypothetical protein [Mesorhizobium alhagi]EHK52729.1 hypothetical protein MAXJ12_33679 [Mesorhizobium alhagi CCNWXJ12-2]